MGTLRKVEREVKRVGRQIDDNIIQPIVDNPAAVVGIGLNFMAPGLGTAIGTALGASGATAAVIGGAVIGGTTAELTGGDFVKGAIGGGVGAGLGALAKGVGGAASGAGAATQGYYDEITGQFIKDSSGGLLAPLTNATSGTGQILGSSFANGQWSMPDGTTVDAPLAGAAQSGADIMKGAGAMPSLNPQGYYDEITGNFIQDPNGGLQGPLTNETSGTADMSNWEVDPAKGTWTDKRTGEVFGGEPGSAWNPNAPGKSGADIMKSAGALPNQAASNSTLKQLLGTGATAAGTSSGLLGAGAPGNAGADQVFGISNPSKYSFDDQQRQMTPQSLMTISQLLGRR